MVETGDGRSRQAIRAPSGTLRSGGIIDTGATNGSRSQGHTEGHLSVCGGCESSLGVSCGAVETTVHDEESAIRKVDELAHGTGLEHIVILFPSRAGSIEWLRGDALTVRGSGNQPGIDEGPGIVTPVILGHVATTTEEDGRGVVVLRGQRKHGSTSRGGVDANDAIGNVRKANLFEGIRVPKHCGDVCLDEHLSGGHHEGVSVRVETGGIDHELHDLGVASGWVKLDSGLSGASLVGGVSIGVVPIDVSTVDETADQSDGTIAEGLSGRIPTRLLHLQHCRIFPPSARGVRDEIRVGAGARVDYTNCTSTVVILVSVVVLSRGTVGVWY